MPYNYSLHGYEENTVLTHEKAFAEDEFKSMCKEALLFIFGSVNAYSASNIIDYLKEKYGYKEAEYTAGFFVAADVEERSNP